MRFFLNGIAGIATLLYPLAVWLGSHYFEPWQMAGLLLIALLLRLLSSSAKQTWTLPALILGIGYFILAAWINKLDALRFYPVLMSSLMLCIFAWSLYFPPSLIERIARLQHPNLPPEGVVYTRQVTQVWCGFFLLNGLVAAYTAVWASLELWTLYNGLIAYVLMGVLMGGEYLVRLRTQKHVR